MALSINIKELIHGSAVESERIKFKEGWSPSKSFFIPFVPSSTM